MEREILFELKVSHEEYCKLSNNEVILRDSRWYKYNHDMTIIDEKTNERMNCKVVLDHDFKTDDILSYKIYRNW